MLATMNGRVLLFSVDPEVRWLGTRTLRGLGLALDWADTWEKALDQLAGEPYDLVIFGPDHFALPKVERVVRELLTKKPRFGPVLITAQKSEHYLPLLRQHPEVRHVMAKQPAIEAPAFRALAVKLLGGDLFGLDKYLHPSCPVQERPIVDSAEKNDIVAEVGSFVSGLTGDQGARNAAEMVIDELVMNVLFAAPRDDARPRNLARPRSERVQLAPAEAGKARWACDGRALYLSVEDPFGALTADVLLAHLEARLSGGSEPLGESGGGGFGLFTVYQGVSTFVANVDPGKRSEVIVSIDMRHPYHEVKRMPRALHLFMP
jgi:hypothetical protein